MGGSRVAGAAIGLVAGLATLTNAFTQPHILMFLADDIGYSDFGYYGMDLTSGGVSATPTIDKYMSEGVILAAVYGGTSCTPGRGSFLSGRYPMRYGIQSGGVGQDSKKGIFVNNSLISNDMQKAGYATLFLGKWHSGCAAEEQMPDHRGFDSYFGFMCMGALDNLYKTQNDLFDFWKDGQPVLDSSTSTRTSTLWDHHAMQFIRESAQERKPVFMFYALQDPHAPLAAPDEYVYTAPCAHIADSTRQTYCGMLKAIDNSVASIMDTIEVVRGTDNTLLCFSGDNGGAPGNGGYNWPLRGSKGSLYEGGIRQATWCWSSENAGLIQQHMRGTVYHGQLSLTDFYPTFLTVATAGHFRLSNFAPLDGKDAWLSISQGAASPREETLLNCVDDSGGIRVGDYVLLVNEGQASYSGHPDGIYDSTFFNTHFGYVNKSKYSSGEGDDHHHDENGDGDDDSVYMELYNVLEDPYQYNNLIDVTDSDGNLVYADLASSIYSRLQVYMAEALDEDYDSNKYDYAEEVAQNRGYWGPWVETLDQISDDDDYYTNYGTNDRNDD